MSPCETKQKTSGRKRVRISFYERSNLYFISNSNWTPSCVSCYYFFFFHRTYPPNTKPATDLCTVQFLSVGLSNFPTLTWISALILLDHPLDSRFPLTPASFYRSLYNNVGPLELNPSPSLYVSAPFVFGLDIDARVLYFSQNFSRKQLRPRFCDFS